MSNFTKKALENTLKKLLMQKPLNKITIQDIADDCGINRMTFYYHFKDIYDLVEWACVEDAQAVLKGRKTYDTWQQGYLELFRMVAENRIFVSNIYRCVGREQAERYLTPLADHLLCNVVDELARGMVLRTEDKAFIARVYSYAFVGVMLDWLKDDMKEPPEQLVERFALVIQDSISGAVNRMRKDGQGSEKSLSKRPE